MIGVCGALRRCGSAWTVKGTQFHCVKFRLESAGEPTICSHCYSVPYMKIPANNQVLLQHRQSPKQLQNSVHLPVFCSTSARFGRGFVSASALVSAAVNTRVFAHGTPSLFHILTSFVRIGPISTLTNRPCHGP